MADIKQPWHRQKTDTPKSFAAFKDYLFMTERSLISLAKDLGKSQRQLEDWSSKYKWVERCEAYDAYLFEKAASKHENEIDKMNDRHIKQSLKLQEIAIKKSLKINPEELTPNEMMRMFDVAARLERTARGATTEKVEIVGEVNHSVVDEEMLKDPNARELLKELYRLNKSRGPMESPSKG